MFKSLRNAFFTGIFALLPVVITLFIIDFLLKSIGLPICRLLLRIFHISVPENGVLAMGIYLVSFLLFALLIAEIGYFSTYMFGRWALRCFDRLVEKLPFVNVVYKTVKQIIDTFRQNSASVFHKTVLVEFPYKGSYGIGFLTSETKGEIQDRTSGDVVNVFLPTSPNPTTGFLLLLPKKDIIELDMSVSDGLKMIVSGGVVNPPRPEKDSALSVAEKASVDPVSEKNSAISAPVD
jgi:uncharacterized membrane protein